MIGIYGPQLRMRPARHAIPPHAPLVWSVLIAFSRCPEVSVYLGEGVAAAMGVAFAAPALGTFMSPLIVWYFQ